jgi:hypothetical protein
LVDCRSAAVLEADLDEKERGMADNLVALAAGYLVASWKLEPTPRRPDCFLKVLSSLTCLSE